MPPGDPSYLRNYQTHSERPKSFVEGGMFRRVRECERPKPTASPRVNARCSSIHETIKNSRKTSVIRAKRTEYRAKGTLAARERPTGTITHGYRDKESRERRNRTSAHYHGSGANHAHVYGPINFLMLTHYALCRSVCFSPYACVDLCR